MLSQGSSIKIDTIVGTACRNCRLCGFPVISGSVTPMRGVTENVPASGCAWRAMAAMTDMIVVSMMVFLIVVFVVLLCRSHVESRVADVVLCRTAHLQK